MSQSLNNNETQTKTGFLHKYLSMSNDSIQKTLFVAVALCLACSVVVAGAAVFLRPIQVTNQALDIKQNIVEVAGLLKNGQSVDEAFSKIETRMVDLSTGEYTDAVDPANYDQRQAVKDASLSQPVPPDQDIAKIKRQAKYAPVYLVKEDDKVKTIILPVHGYGLWSTMYGFLAIENDLNTVVGLKFYDQKETPGLGGEVENPLWRAQWEAKKLHDEQDQLRIAVLKGTVDKTREESQYQVDGLAGSTITSRGVTNLLHYWLGENGFGPYLDQLSIERG
jgi:Na+-transporting NADH:ubiquinone oxidoreductase subunit C